MAVRPFARGRLFLGVFAFAATSAMVMCSVVDPSAGALANPFHSSPYAPVSEDVLTSVAQELDATGDYENNFTREGYAVEVTPKVVEPPVEEKKEADTDKATAAKTPAKSPAAPNAGPPNPGSAQAIAFDLVAARGWDQSQYSCLVALWNKESGWRYNAANPSGAYGIPQALPGRKMASAGADWQTNPATQITWGLGYITGRYGSPCGAWAKSQSSGWY
ncbi:aggregation-promoting factor C-terminal-like domain-containing protein [Mycetocola spongiae]|uniref:aggregation-promoting factor C-terminal-like domain-containing protein n=1 Tax=Mycetocola spongiae TaxID=2859226 RepID=UPI001CF25D40|nr:transglycosylase SLT domain-containing protein [Mycetocola spongiae]